jgi:hypothetical protein
MIASATAVGSCVKPARSTTSIIYNAVLTRPVCDSEHVLLLAGSHLIIVLVRELVESAI